MTTTTTTTTTNCRSFIIAGNRAKTARGIVLFVAVSIVVCRAVIRHAKEAAKLVAYCIGEGKRIADARSGQ